MAQETVNPDGEVVLAEELGNARVVTLNRPEQLNVISSNVVKLLAANLEKWEKDENAKLVIIKGAGRAFSAGGDLKMFYDGRNSKDSCLEVVYRMYWLCNHIHTYKKPTVALVHGISMGGGASLMAPMMFSVVTEKTVFATPEASIGYHTDCGFSYMLSRLPGRLGEYLGLTGARLIGKELVAAGLATHFVPLENYIKHFQQIVGFIFCHISSGGSNYTEEVDMAPAEKLPELEKHLLSLNTGDEAAVGSAIKEFSTDVQIDEESILKKHAIIDECFSKNCVAEIISSFEAEAGKEGNSWIMPVLKCLKRSSPTGLKVTLRSNTIPSSKQLEFYKEYHKKLIVIAGKIREGRKQTLSECLKKEFRITINTLRTRISGDVYEGIRSLTIDKDNSPKWDPPTLEKVEDERVNLIFEPFEEELELKVSENELYRWDGKYEDSAYCHQ